MKILWWRDEEKDAEIEQAKERVARTAEIIAEQREQVNEVVQQNRRSLEINHLADKFRAAFGDNPR